MKSKLKKTLISSIPYVFIALFATKFGQTWRLADGITVSEKFLHIADGISKAMDSPLPSFHPLDLLVGVIAALIIRLIVYEKSKNAKKYRRNVEYGSARWGKPEDIAPYIDPDFRNNNGAAYDEQSSERPENSAKQKRACSRRFGFR